MFPTVIIKCIAKWKCNAMQIPTTSTGSPVPPPTRLLSQILHSLSFIYHTVWPDEPPGDKYILIELITNVWPYVFLFQPQVSNSELLRAIVNYHNLVTFDNNHYDDRSALEWSQEMDKLG